MDTDETDIIFTLGREKAIKAKRPSNLPKKTLQALAKDKSWELVNALAVFIIGRFHSTVNIKFDTSNYGVVASVESKTITPITSGVISYPRSGHPTYEHLMLALRNLWKNVREYLNENLEESEYFHNALFQSNCIIAHLRDGNLKDLKTAKEVARNLKRFVVECHCDWKRVGLRGGEDELDRLVAQYEEEPATV